MKSIIPVAFALAFALSYEATTAQATPVQGSGAGKQARQNIGEVTLCSLSGQCATVRLPLDGTTVCTSFTGNLAFLNDNLRTATFTSSACSAYLDVGCSGTNLGGDIALPGTLTVDYTHIEGQNVSGLASSIRCTFL